MRSFSTVFVVTLAAHQASAQGWDIGAAIFRSPENCNNNCNPQQSQGWDWGSLNPGNSVGSYGGCNFDGWQCLRSSKKQKRDGSPSNCIAGSIDKGSGPSFDGYAQGFSIAEMEISAEQDTLVEAHFGMPDGSRCLETFSCGSELSTVTNKQCGGATSVSYCQPSTIKTASCSLTLHSVSFNCGSSSTLPPPPPPPPPQTTTQSTTTPQAPPQPTPPYLSTTNPTLPPSTSPTTTPTMTPSTTLSTTQIPKTTPKPSTPPYQPPGQGFGNSSAPTPPSSRGHPHYSSSPAPPPSDLSPPPTTLATSTTATPSAPVSTPPPYSAPPARCPGLVPSCLNTWMWSTGCKDNSDASCYCKDEKFISAVMGCIGAWGGSCAAYSEAASYLVGICGSYLGSNAALITAVPSCAHIGSPAPTPPASTSTLTFTSTNVVTVTTCPSQDTKCPFRTSNVVQTGTSLVIVSATVGTTVYTTVPCTTIPYVTAGSTTNIVVPAVAFTTGPSPSGSSPPSIGLVQPPPPSGGPGAAYTTTTATGAMMPTPGANSSTTSPGPAPFPGLAVPIGPGLNLVAVAAGVAVLLI